MKWGVRKKQRVERNLSRLDATRKQNKVELDHLNKVNKIKYSSPNKAKRLAKINAYNKAGFDITETTNKYAIERQKAKLDKTHKQSEAYKSAKKAYKKEQTQQLIYGPFGSQKIRALQNQGKTEKQAKGRVAVEQVLLGAAAGLAVSVYMKKMLE